MKEVVLLCLLGLAGYSLAAESCCGDLGCFGDAPPYDHWPTPWCPDELRVNFYLYTRENRGNAVTVTRDRIPIQFDGRKKTVFLVHGWFGGEFTSWLEYMTDAILTREDVNVIEVYWNSLELWYPNSASSTRTVGAEIGMIASVLTSRAGNSQGNQWCIGHSLGGHTCGYAGRKHKLGRITAMDPAGPSFEGYAPEVSIMKSDADFVEVIHTNAWASLVLPLGHSLPLGHVDFYPNGGYQQPGCILDPYNGDEKTETYGDLTVSCSHMRVLDLMIESVNTDRCTFLSRQKCSDHNDMGSCRTCPGIICQVMGYDSIDFPGRGIFYLSTNTYAPFCQQ